MCKAASEQHKLTELHKLLPLLGNRGTLLETRKAVVGRRKEGRQCGVQQDMTIQPEILVEA